MGRAKEITIRVILAKIANDFVRKNHYSGKVCSNSVLHLGAYLDNVLHGVMSFGSPLDKRKVIGLVEGTLWNEMLELNRMALDERLPQYSESRCLAVAFKLIKKNAPHIKWILSFADATQCGDGAIYRASGFVLIGVHKSQNIAKLNNGYVVHKMTLESAPLRKHPYLNNKSYSDYTNGLNSWNTFLDKVGGIKLNGFQLRYIKLLKSNLKLTVPIIPFSKIDEIGAGMYRGKSLCRDSLTSRTPAIHAGGEVRNHLTAQN